MHAHTARQEALETTKRQPDNAPLDEIFYVNWSQRARGRSHHFPAERSTKWKTT